MSSINELDFGLDNFQKPKILSPKESVAQIILNLFMMRPGNYPSMPHVGIDIRSYLYKLEGDLDVEDLKKKIFTQCSELLSFISIGDIQVVIAPHQGQSILIVLIPLIGFNETMLIGFRKDEANELLFNYQFTDTTVFN